MNRNLIKVSVALALCSMSGAALADWTAKSEVRASFATGNS